MAQTDLLWNSITICASPWYHLAGSAPGRMAEKDIVWPHSTGRDAMNLGASRDDATSRHYRFAESGINRNRIVAATQEALVTIIDNLHNKAVADPIGDLEFGEFGTSGSQAALPDYRMRIRFGDILPAIGITGAEWQATFEALFIKID